MTVSARSLTVTGTGSISRVTEPVTTTINTDTFRTWFPEFKDVGKYSDFMVDFYITWAADLMGDRMTQPPNYDGTGAVPRWGNQFDRYVALLAAHCLTLAAQNQATAATGGAPGAQVGVPSEQHVGPVGIGYNTEIGIAENAGWFGGTMYGNMWFEHMILVGSGGLVI